MLDVRDLELGGVKEIRTARLGDERGFFSEVWNAATWRAAGIEAAFVQDNFSLSRGAGVLRGLHYQIGASAQDKLVRVTRGAIFDVAVDIRRSSPTFGRWIGVELSEAEWNQLFIPKGFAHGFVTLTAGTEVSYKVSAAYAPEDERAIRFDDPAIGIAWPSVGEPYQLSPRDRTAPLLEASEVFA